MVFASLSPITLKNRLQFMKNHVSIRGDTSSIESDIARALSIAKEPLGKRVVPLVVLTPLKHSFHPETLPHLDYDRTYQCKW